jgi:hypothetical protein
MKGLKEIARQRQKLLAFEFMNDAGINENPLNSYGAANVEILKKASLKWDPDGVFQLLQCSGYLLKKIGAWRGS